MLLATDSAPDAVLSLADTAWATFTPRPNRPAEFDEQRAYIEARDLVSFCLGGNASGKTAASAKKCADFVLSTPPPRKNTPFWIVGATYKQVCAVCWSEKLHGQQFIPDSEVEINKIRWHNASMGWPATVPLRPWPNGNNWTLEFMSYEQGRGAMQARSIGGCWFSEQFPWAIFVEVLRGCRDYMFPGGQFAEFTPIEPELCVSIEKIMDDPPAGWGFYRLNTEKNRQNLAADWYDSFFGSVSDEMMATRKTGALATFEGVIYQTFNPAVHVIDDDSMVWRSGVTFNRATDWGASAEHPFACGWFAEDGMGDVLMFDEYWDTSQDKITQDHAAEVLARSIAWGWPEPDYFSEPDAKRAFFVKAVRKRVKELCGTPGPVNIQNHYRENYADPSRPGEMNAFNYWGVPTSPASNDVYKGIDIVRSLLKVNPVTGRPRLYIHRRCKHAVEELRKYRWDRKKPNALWTTAAPRPVPLKKWDDVADVIRYRCASTARDRGQAPSSADSRLEGVRRELLLQRAGNGHALRPMQAATAGFFRR